MNQAMDSAKGFTPSSTGFFQLTEHLGNDDTLTMRHTAIEHILGTEGRDVLRRLFEDHCRLRNIGDVGAQIVGADGVVRTHKKIQSRRLLTLYGAITIERLGYGYRGVPSLFPKDALLNLPSDSYSHGVRKLVAYEASKSSFSEVVWMIEQCTGIKIPKHTVEELANKAAVDFDAFYDQKNRKKDVNPVIPPSLLVLSTDAKGIVMRKADLKKATRKAAELRLHKYRKRQAKGEKAHAKRMAAVATVYGIERFVRTPQDILKEMRDSSFSVRRPRPVDKRVWASIEKEAIAVTEDLFAEALYRDPDKRRQWVCLVDGDPRQLGRVKTVARQHGVEVSIILDIIHVIEYLWKAAWCFFQEGDMRAEDWVSERLLAILKGKAAFVAAGIRRSATRKKFSLKDRKAIDKCAGYLLKNKHYLEYNRYLQEGWPIASGVIEGACRHLIKDRMDVTGARLSLNGAEAILKLRSFRSSGDFEEYWEFHEDQEYARNHLRLYAEPMVLDKLGVKRGLSEPGSL